MKKLKLKCSILWFVIGIVLLICGITIYFVIPVIVHQQISKMLPLKNGSLIYNEWQNTTLPAYIQFWYFDVLNPLEILNGEKPSLRQIGPYTYREYRVKYDILFHSNGSVSYLQKRLFYFDRDKSVGDETDTFTTVNIPVMVIGDKFENSFTIFKEFISAVLKSFETYGLFMKTSVKNITWGYEDPFLMKANEIANKIPGIHFNMDPNIGLFYGKNNTNDSVYIADSGNINLDNYLKIESWNGSDRLSMWNDKYANMVNGTDGSMFAPYLNRSSKLYIFQSDICRSIYATYVGSDEIKGVPSMNYAAPDSVFANHSVNPDNEGFCLDGNCMGAGVLNLSKCVPGGAPIIMSQPHFYSAADKYIDGVFGINPSSEFKTVLKLESTTGLPLQLAKKLQINIAVKPITDFLKMDNVRAVVIPMMWLNESVLISDALAGTLRNTLVLPVLIGKWGAVALMVLGILLMAFIGIVQLKHVCHQPMKSYTKINEDT